MRAGRSWSRARIRRPASRGRRSSPASRTTTTTIPRSSSSPAGRWSRSIRATVPTTRSAIASPPGRRTSRNGARNACCNSAASPPMPRSTPAATNCISSPASMKRDGAIAARRTGRRHGKPRRTSSPSTPTSRSPWRRSSSPTNGRSASRCRGIRRSTRRSRCTTSGPAWWICRAAPSAARRTAP